MPTPKRTSPYGADRGSEIAKARAETRSTYSKVSGSTKSAGFPRKTRRAAKVNKTAIKIVTHPYIKQTHMGREIPQCVRCGKARSNPVHR